MSKIVIDQKQAIKHLGVWRKRLGLKDWDIYIRFTNKLSQEGRMAEIDFLPSKRRAKISMLKSYTKKLDPWGLADLELNVIHELLHCWFATSKMDYEVEEWAVHSISMALWKAYH